MRKLLGILTLLAATAGFAQAPPVGEPFHAALTSPTIDDPCNHRTNLGVLFGLDTGLFYRCDPTIDKWTRLDVQLGSLTSWGVQHEKRAGSSGTTQDLPIVTLTFDDGAYSQYEQAWPLMKDRDLPGTFCISALWDVDLPYCNTNCAASECPEARITEAEALAWFTDGADLQSHSETEIAFLSNTWNDVIQDWSDHASWFYTNLGYYPETYCVPGGSWDLEGMVAGSGTFQQVASSTSGWNPSGGLVSNEYAGHRFFGSRDFFSVAGETGANVCEYVRNAVVPDSSAWLNLGFHCFLAAGQTVVTNEYPIDDFEEILDCLQTMRDDGLIEVLTYGDAVKRRKRTRGRWNKLVNTGFGHVAGSTTLAHQWQQSNLYRASTEVNGDTTTPRLEFQQNDDAWDFRQARFVAGPQAWYVLNQYVDGLVPGRSYVFAVDVEYESIATSSASHADTRLEIHSFSGGGDDPGTGVGSDVKSMLRRPTGESAGYREVHWVEFNAPGPLLRFRAWATGYDQIDEADECGTVCENSTLDATGVTMTDSDATLHDVTGWRIYNRTDASNCIVTSYTGTTAVCTAGLLANDGTCDTEDCEWQVNDEYYFEGTVWTYRYPRVFETEVLGGGTSDTYSHKLEWSALVPFKRRWNFNAVGDCCTDAGCSSQQCADCCVQDDECESGKSCFNKSSTSVSFTGSEYENVPVLEHAYPSTLEMWGEGPTAFLITRMEVIHSNPATADYEVRFHGCRSNVATGTGLCSAGRGTTFWEKTNLSGSFDSETIPTGTGKQRSLLQFGEHNIDTGEMAAGSALFWPGWSEHRDPTGKEMQGWTMLRDGSITGVAASCVCHGTIGTAGTVDAKVYKAAGTVGAPAPVLRYTCTSSNFTSGCTSTPVAWSCTQAIGTTTFSADDMYFLEIQENTFDPGQDTSCVGTIEVTYDDPDLDVLADAAPGNHGTWMLLVKDEYGNNEFYDLGSGNAVYPAGNELHLEIKNDEGTARTFTVEIEGFVLK